MFRIVDLVFLLTSYLRRAIPAFLTVVQEAVAFGMEYTTARAVV